MSKNPTVVKHILSQDWYNKGFEGSTFSLHVWQGMFRIQDRPLFKARFTELMTITTGGRCEWFWNRKDLLAIRKWLITAVSRDWRFGFKLVNIWKTKLKPVQKICAELE